MSNIIEINKLRKRYPGSKEFALKGISLYVKRGDFFGLLGPNGSGKTTLISILCGLLDPTQGSIEIAGEQIPKHFKRIKQKIGLVPQDIALYPKLTFRENLTYFGRLYGLPHQRLKQRTTYCIELAGLDRFADQTIANFSGGMRRRANLVTSLLHEPELLFLDEPTVNVDPQSRHVIFEILQKINRGGTTLVYTTHYIEQAQKMCSTVAIIDYGKLLCEDSPKGLIENTPNSQDLGDVFLNLTGRALRD